MKHPLANELRSLLPAWLFCALLPLPVILIPRFDDGVPWRMSCFSFACAWLVADAVYRWTVRNGRDLMQLVGGALLAATAVFSILCLALNGSRDWLIPFKALYVSALAISIVLYVMLTVQNRFVAVVLSIFSIFCLKLFGCAIVVLVYAWDTSESGYTTMPWTQPNLLFWLSWSFGALLSLVFCFLGTQKYETVYGTAGATLARHDHLPCFDP